MVRLSDQFITGDSPCPYFEGRDCRFEIFFAVELSGEELEEYISKGWRKFGPYYFAPRCTCRECVPVRTRVNEFSPTKEQRRILRKNADIQVRFGPLSFREEIFEIYLEHSRSRFGKEETRESFLEHFYIPSCPALQSEFYLDGNLIAVGFLDRSSLGLSSVYFCYRDAASKRGIGIFSMLAEINFAKESGIAFYYPGYYIKDNSHMNYKNRFKPCEYFDWESGRWIDEGARNV